MISLQPLTIKFEISEEFTPEEYLEYCEDYEIKPSKNHYEEWATETFESCLRDAVNILICFSIFTANHKKLIEVKTND